MLRVDGGMVASDWTMQRLADIIDAPVDRPRILETTALGAAWLAGSRAGVWPKAREFARSWALDTRFMPEMSEALESASSRAGTMPCGARYAQIKKAPRSGAGLPMMTVAYLLKGTAG